MRTLLPDPPPAEFEALLDRRRRWGADRFDEIWKGVYRVMPAPGYAHRQVEEQLEELLRPLGSAAGLRYGGAFNLGDPDDYRIPDRALYRPEDGADWQATAALVIEILSRGDETWEKVPFYAAHGVGELLVIDPQKRTVEWFSLERGEYRPVDASRVIDFGPAELAQRIDWPPAV